jgi:sporulation protein YlmC with PRC-barrel domain
MESVAMCTDTDSCIPYDLACGGNAGESASTRLKEKKEQPMAEPKSARGRDIVPAKSVIGSTVVNANYEDLGTIEDLVLDAGAGRIAYAVLSFGGFLGVGDKYFAVPWYAFQFHLAEKRIVLNVDKKLLENAPGFDKTDWPNMADSTWGTSIYKHYGLAPYWEETIGDRPDSRARTPHS